MLDEVNSALSWYQDHVGALDKAKWELTVEERILNGITHIPTKSTTLTSELIDLDLVQGSSFPKAKAKHGLFAIARHGLRHLIFLPFYSSWWIPITSRRIYQFFLFLYGLQFINIWLYMTQPRHKYGTIGTGSITKYNGTWSELLDYVGTNATSGYNYEDIVLQTSEIFSPFVLMIVLTILHSQIIATNSSLYNKKRDDKPNTSTTTVSSSANKRLSLNQSSSTTSSRSSQPPQLSNTCASGSSGRRRGSGSGLVVGGNSNQLNPTSVKTSSRNKRSRTRYPPPSRRRSSATTYNNNSPQRNINNSAVIGIGGGSKKNEDVLPNQNSASASGLRRRQLLLHDLATNNSNANIATGFVNIGGGEETTETILASASAATGYSQEIPGKHNHHNQQQLQSQLDVYSSSATSIPTTGVVPKLIITSNNNNNYTSSMSSLKNSNSNTSNSFGNLIVKKVLFEDESPKVQQIRSSSTNNHNHNNNLNVLISCSCSSNSDKDEGIAEELNSNEQDDDYHFSLSVHDPIIKRNLAETLSSFERDEAMNSLNKTTDPTFSPPITTNNDDSCTCNCYAASKSNVCNCNISLNGHYKQKCINECQGSAAAAAVNVNVNGSLLNNANAESVIITASSASANNNIMSSSSSPPPLQNINYNASSIIASDNFGGGGRNGGGIIIGCDESESASCNLLNNTNQSPPTSSCLNNSSAATQIHHTPTCQLLRRKQSESTSMSCDEEFQARAARRRRNNNKQSQLRGCGGGDDEEEEEAASDDEDGNTSSDADKDDYDENHEKCHNNHNDDDDEIRSKSEWTAVTTNSEDEDYVAEEDNDNDNDSEYNLRRQNNEQDAFFENHPYAWEFPQHGKPLYNANSICTPSDKVSCTFWEGEEAKKADLTVLDISATIISKVERARENSDYLYLGMIFSIILAALPCLWRLNLDNLLETDDLYDFTKLSGYLVDTINQTCGISLRSRLLILITSFERLCLSFCIFFLLTVAEKTYKQRFLYSKLFSRITSTRKAKKSGIPHFRLNKVRNIKTWLSVRSYLQRRGPQRSVNVIVSSIFMSTILLVFFLSIELLKDSGRMYYLYNIEVLIWSLFLGVFLLRFMTLGARISQKYKNFQVIITEQLNLFLKMEQKPQKKEELCVANNVLKLAAELLKELEDPFKISSFATNPYLYNLTRLVILSAFSGVLSEMLGFKLKLYKIKIK